MDRILVLLEERRLDRAARRGHVGRRMLSCIPECVDIVQCRSAQAQQVFARLWKYVHENTLGLTAVSTVVSSFTLSALQGGEGYERREP